MGYSPGWFASRRGWWWTCCRRRTQDAGHALSREDCLGVQSTNTQQSVHTTVFSDIIYSGYEIIPSLGTKNNRSTI